MVKKIVKRGGLALGVLAIFIGIGTLYAWWNTNRAMNKVYDIDVVDVQIPSDSVRIANGKHIAHIRGCVECHGRDLSGKAFADDAFFGRLMADNLTSGQGGLGSIYSTKDWVRTIRHGVKPDGKTVIFMPAHEFTVLTKPDLEDLIAYLKSVPPVDHTLPENDLNMPIRVMYTLTGTPHLFPAELIDHKRPIDLEIDKSSPLVHGKYLATTCLGCHGENFKGGPIPGVPPEWPEAANISADGYFSTHTYDDFKKVLRTGVNAEGRTLNGQFMPWPVFKHMTDDELQSLYAFLKSK
jgi:mono/diheme cytochrome c family protein